MDAIIRWVDQANRILLYILRMITIVCFVFLTVLITANVLVRFFPLVSLHWFDEIIEMLYAYLIFYGSAALWITKEHFSVGDWIGNRVLTGERARHSYRILLEILSLTFIVIFFYYSLKLTVLARDVTNVFALPKRLLYACMPVSGAIMAVASIGSILKGIREMIGLQAER